jgi:hypothetical protein
VHNGAKIYEHSVLVSDFIIVFERGSRETDWGVWELCRIPTCEEEEDEEPQQMDGPEPEPWKTLYAAAGSKEGGPPSTGWRVVCGPAPAPSDMFKLQSQYSQTTFRGVFDGL